MNKMTYAQKKYINEVILPTLVTMAIEGTLDSDMNALSTADFAVATEKFNAENQEATERAKRLNALGCYVSEDDLDDALTRIENATDDQCMDDVVTMCHACESMGSMGVNEFYNGYL